VRVNVTGAKNDADAVLAARTVAQSPLVKTALFGNDPNWGRIIAALGRSGAKMGEEKTDIFLCGEAMFQQGKPCRFDAAALSEQMKAKQISLDVDLGMGKGKATVLTCDFSYDYVKINADYHT